MRLLVAPGAVVLLGVLGGCSLGGTQHTAAITSRSASPSAAVTYDPLAGPVEAASLLPKSCSKILSDTDLAAAFGATQTGDDSYGSYAPLPNIGRTGRVTCGFGIGIDEFGHPSPAAVTVSLITYSTAANAVSRVASDVSGNVAKGATARPLLVSGHPATVLVSAPSAPAQASASPSGSAGVSASPAASPSGAASVAASPSASAAPAGETELLMADGNRTFVLEIPLTKLAGADAVNALVSLAALVYQHTTPTGTSASAPAPPSASATVSASASASPSAPAT
jgi:hypothetical protein